MLSAIIDLWGGLSISISGHACQLLEEEDEEVMKKL
jgi:hypothetical protein